MKSTKITMLVLSPFLLQQILKTMIEANRDFPDSAPAPNTISYNNVLLAWSRSTSGSGVHRVESILNFMIHSGEHKIVPDVYSFTTVLNTLAKSKEPNKAQRAQEHLETMLKIHDKSAQNSFRLTQAPFNAVLNAAAFSALGTPQEEQRNAIKTAVHTFSLMKKLSVPPDMISYGNILKAVANLVPRGKIRSEMALQLFKTCCRDGLVSDLVWNEARRALPADLLKSVVREKKPLSSLTSQDLPKSWKMNLPRKGRAQSKNRDSLAQKAKKVEQRKKEPVQRFRRISEESYQSGRDV
jgi:hypothetical protein